MVTMPPNEAPSARVPLSRERVLRAAIELADAGGLAAVSMRRVAAELGVEAMTLYYHVANKQEMLNGMVDLVEREIELPAAGDDWKEALRRTVTSAHESLRRHPWASLVTSHELSPSRLAYMEGILGTLRRAGFTPHQAHLGYHALESHTVGFALWLSGMALPDDLTDLVANVLREVSAEEFPYFVEHLGEHLEPSEPDAGTFAFGLGLILDGLERMRPSRTGSGKARPGGRHSKAGGARSR